MNAVKQPPHIHIPEIVIRPNKNFDLWATEHRRTPKPRRRLCCFPNSESSPWFSSTRLEPDSARARSDSA